MAAAIIPLPAGGRFARALAILLALLFAMVAATPTVAQHHFPALTGRLVDPAGLVPAARKAEIEAKLRDLEGKSGIQLVAALIPSLDGRDVESYANLLFRDWKLGEKQKNNGVLLLIATGDRKIRIEVGYGLEGTLTDAISKIIIANAIAPSLRAGDYPNGVARGVDDIIAVLSNDSAEWQKRPYAPKTNYLVLFLFGVFILVALFIIFGMWSSRKNAGAATRSTGATTTTTASVSPSPAWSTSSSSDSGSSSESFSGGGGSSGGGGASGDY